MIYFLEDDDSIRKLVIYGLESQGFEAEGFSLPSKFWRAMEQHPAELVLLDIMLPEEDGLQILKKLRAAPETRRLPVILLTAKNSEFDRVIGLDNGADDFISKPFSGLPVSWNRMTSSLLPATFFRPSPISAMPNRNSAIPLSREITFEILMSGSISIESQI